MRVKVVSCSTGLDGGYEDLIGEEFPAKIADSNHYMLLTESGANMYPVLKKDCEIVVNEGASKDHINPTHYKQYPVEVIDMMLAIFGKEATRNYCLMTAFKYRMRLGHKDAVEQELKKEAWYLAKAEELK